MTVKYTTNESGDWAILEVGSFKHEGHSIPPHVWLEVMGNLGHAIIESSVTDEVMEGLCGA